MLAEQRRSYENFLLPVFICDIELNIHWHNRTARDLYPQLTDPEGMHRLLGGFDADELLARLTRDGALHVDGTPAFTGVKLSLTPITQNGETLGVMCMLVGPQAVISPPDITANSRTHRNIETSIRNSVAEIFDIMDDSAIKANLVGDKAALRAFAGIERSGYRLLRIAANISAYTAFQMNPPHACSGALDVFDFIRDSQASVTAFAGETGIDVDFDLPDKNTPAIAKVDKSHLQLVYSNLLNNAFYFTKPGNSVKIVGKLGRGCILLTVLDKGVGIPVHLLPDTVFKPFFSYGHSNRQAGIGLGLALVKMVADGYGGSIRVSSVENEWTAATFILPKWNPSEKLTVEQDTKIAHNVRGYDDRFSYASLSLRAAAGSPYITEQT